MKFDDTFDEAAFRARARAWIADNAPLEYEAECRASGFGNIELRDADTLAVARAWQRKKFDAGWGVPKWPLDYGGGGLSPIEQAIWREEEGVFAKLSQPFSIGVGMCGPTLMAWASEEQRRELLPRLASGEQIWCQLFSEPAAGSDLAGVRTLAERSGDDWIVSGQKIWTSGAHRADWGLLLARTDPGVPKHRGLTMFFIDMRSPGVSVRPIRQMNEESVFNEVFFENVHVPDKQRLGAVGQGWTVSLTTLMNERSSIGASMPTGFDQLIDLCRTLEHDAGSALADPPNRTRLAEFAIRHYGLRFTGFRLMSALSRGGAPGPESSIGKLVAGSLMQEIAKFALDLQGPAGSIVEEDVACDSGRFQRMLLRSPATRIEGGSDEILRNIIAERVLGLPTDIRVDKDVAFDRIPTATTR